MRRHPESLDGRVDVLVLGGGVLGIALTRLLARSGLSVALVERGDFGGETTRNSLKIMHGGFRYIQHLDVPRIRESVRAQRAWLSAAPHLVRPLRFTVPTTGWGVRGPLALGAGMVLYRLLAGDRNRGLPPGVVLPRMALGSSASFRRRFPEIQAGRINGCASWVDAQVRDSGRLMTECIADAAAAGALVLNHVEAVGLLRSGNRIAGAALRDRLTGREYELRAAVTVGALGAWGAGLMRASGIAPPALSQLTWTRNVNIVLKEPVVAGGAVGVMSERRGGYTTRAARLYFMTPWHDVSIVGTAHDVYRGDPDALGIDENEIDGLLHEMGAMLAGRRLSLDDVACVHMGLTPSEDAGGQGARRAIIADYARRAELDGYLEVAANKYTTAPTVARTVARKVLRRLSSARCVADFGRPLPAAPASPEPLEPAASAADTGEWERAWVSVVYGTRSDQVLAFADAETAGDPVERVFRARVRFGVREELAVRLGDALFRCSDLAERGRLQPAHVRWCADYMARELRWPDERRAEELDLAVRLLRRHMSGGRGASWLALDEAGSAAASRPPAPRGLNA
jgi:glycerol-3-phosphate dehydrogenase